jgi:inosine-uridine nucleoside N-ribohydrolase
MAFQRNSRVMRELEELIIMGGAFRTHGNVDSLSEFNFYADPHAADYVLQKTEGVCKVLVPLDVTHKVILTPTDLKELGDSMSAKLAKSIAAKYQRAYLERGFKGNPLHDPLAMGYCIDDSFLKLKPLSVHVETQGIYTRGMCVSEERPWVHEEPNLAVALEVKPEKFLGYFKKAISA